jgi:hypothetical protein
LLALFNTSTRFLYLTHETFLEVHLYNLQINNKPNKAGKKTILAARREGGRGWS